MSVVLVTNTIGLISSLICIILFFFIVSRDSKFMNRVTLRLQVALSTVDFIGHILLYLQKGDYSERTCSFIGFSIVYQNSLYVSIVFFVTLILHINFLGSKKFDVKYEKFIWGAIAIIPLIHNLPPLVLDMFGQDAYGFCFINAKDSNQAILTFTNLIIPITVVFIYSLSVAIIIIYKVRTDYSLTNRIISAHKAYDPNSSILLQRLLQSWISRLIMYPTAFCLMDSGLVVDFFLQTVFGYTNNGLFFWAAIGGSLSGFFNLIAFLFDPYFQYAFKKLWLNYQQNDTTCPSSLASEPYSHEIRMVDFNGVLPGQVNNQSVNTLDVSLNEDEAVALLQGCTKNC